MSFHIGNRTSTAFLVQFQNVFSFQSNPTSKPEVVLHDFELCINRILQLVPFAA